MKRLTMAVSLLLALLAGFAAFRLMPKPLPEISRKDFLIEVRTHHVAKVVIDDGVITGVSSKRGAFRTAYDRADTHLPSELRKQGVTVVFDRSQVVTP